MVRLFPISDLHGNFIDVNRDAGNSPFNMRKMKSVWSPTLRTGDDTILFACGDIGERMQGVMWCERMLQVFPTLNICYCPGNHEFYGSNIDLLLHDMHIADATSCDRLHILDGYYKCHTVVSDQMGRPLCTVVGGTLWTNFNDKPEDGEENPVDRIMDIAKRNMNDYKYIRSGNDSNSIKPTRILNMHYETRKEIFKQIERADKDIPLIGMSHHTPYMDIPYDALHYCYHVDMTEEFNNASRVPTYWFSGHTHQSKTHKESYTAGTVEFVSNQIGYPHQFSTGFSMNCILEVQ